MDWDIIFSSAIGTLAGTTLSVLVAWCIYHKEKEDNIKRKQEEYKNKVAEECIELINKVVINTFQFERFFHESYRKGASQEKMHDVYFNFANDFQTNTKKLGISGTILYNLYEADKFEELQTFLDRSMELTTSINELENFSEIKEGIERRVNDLQELGDEIVLDIQEEMINNLDHSLVENNKEKISGTD
ncbi:hypothetical protein [Salinicoccus roseus]|uniref:Uncharacterized protein n=1 Tax=Salinicoccus roseus TaxID=45670 RepID=A0A0C2HEJ8_9STAP|nr:hypothetical protein [Salinicoccus roseus]KIH70059.1 hypothetical protein SN16_11195 [Salinicoccus roseus]MDB0581369.1 hypothetical protein [Salinicoccus roseus]